MFDLEKSIANWVEEIFAEGVMSSIQLEELEIHLCEEIERQIKLGLNEQEAFRISVQQIGSADILKNEFKKINEVNVRKYMDAAKLKPIGIVLVFGVIVIAILLQTFTNNFISFRHDGATAAVIFHWPVFLAIALHFAGLICLAWPMRAARLQNNC